MRSSFPRFRGESSTPLPPHFDINDSNASSASSAGIGHPGLTGHAVRGFLRGCGGGPGDSAAGEKVGTPSPLEHRFIMWENRQSE